MPTVDATIQYGDIPETGGIIDEPNLLVQSLTITPRREKKAYKGGSKATTGLLYTDPQISFAYKAIISEESGLAVGHPGSEVTSLTNFASARYGFDPADGILVFEDPSVELDQENPDMISFTVVNYPFIAAS